jgi:ATP-dependent Clp protease protease subunit
MNDEERRHARTIDRLLKDRIIFLGTPIDDESSRQVLAQFLYLLDADEVAPISFYLNSPGGSVAASFAILDVMAESTAPITTTCVGTASGMAALILASGTRGQRFALPHAEMRITQLAFGRSSLPRTEEQERERRRLEALVVGRLAEATSRTEETVRADMRSELHLDAYSAKRYGLIDEVIKV